MSLYSQSMVRLIFILTLSIILLSQLGFSGFAWYQFERELRPELHNKAIVVADSVSQSLSNALSQGIPFEKLHGVENFLDTIRNSNPDIAFFVLQDLDGHARYLSGLEAKLANNLDQALLDRYEAVPIELKVDSQAVGRLVVGMSPGYAQQRIDEIRIDVFIVMAISLMVAFELLLFIVSNQLIGPMRAIHQQIDEMARGDFRHVLTQSATALTSLSERLNAITLSVNRMATELAQQTGRALSEIEQQFSGRVRLATEGAPQVRNAPQVMQVRVLTFLFIFGEQLSSPFLPLFVKQLAVGVSDFTAGLPIVVFMFGVALSMPVLGTWSDRVGRSKTFLLGAFLMIVGLCITGLANDLNMVILGRLLTGIGYSSTFVACQGFVLDNVGPNQRTRGLALFVGAILVAGICAPGIGGLLADRVGYPMVFIFGAAIMLIAGILAYSVMSKAAVLQTSSAKIGAKLTWRDFGRAVSNPRFVMVLIGTAIPAKMVLTGFLYYLVPLALRDLGSTQAEIGRAIMLYGVPGLILTSPLAAVADRYHLQGFFVGLGGLITGIGMTAVLLWPGLPSIIVAIILLGFSQSFSISPQAVLVQQVCANTINQYGSGAVMGIYRLVERSGAALGPLVAGALVHWEDPVTAIGLLGVICVLVSTLFSVFFLLVGVERESEQLSHIDEESV